MAMRTYKAYFFRSNAKDPVIAELRTAIMRKAGTNRIDGALLSEIEENGGPSVSAQRGWHFGKTRRPNNATVEAAIRAMGLRRIIVDPDKKRS